MTDNTDEPMYPDLDIPVNDGPEGNAMAILSTLRQGLQRRKMDHGIISSVIAEATSGDYDQVLRTVGKYATIEHT